MHIGFSGLKYRTLKRESVKFLTKSIPTMQIGFSGLKCSSLDCKTFKC